MGANLCNICQSIFSGNRIVCEDRPHHQSKQSILDAAKNGCRLCLTITKSMGFRWFEVADSEPFKATWYLTVIEDHPERSGWLQLIIDAINDDDYVGSAKLMNEGANSSAQKTNEVDDDGKVWVPKNGTEVDGAGIYEHPPWWAFQLVPTTDASSAHLYSLPPGPDDPHMWSLARSWLDNCIQCHPQCKIRNPNFRPTRLVEILSTSRIRLVERGERDLSEPYASFSHCWGQAKTLKLLKDNLQRLKSGVEITELPQSYKEALNVATKLGIKFIWIDSLCIIQDSAEDWRDESATMGSVYSNALMNISASSAAENSGSSFLHRDAQLLDLPKLDPQWNGISEQQYILMNRESFEEELEKSPLRGRSWVLQEWFLCPRNLSLTHTQLWWECHEATINESWVNHAAELRPFIETIGKRTGGAFELAHHHKRWCDLVERYSECKLTVFTDKMIAISGLAEHFQNRFFENDEYVAGMWRSQLAQSLCWTSPGYHKVYRPAQYRAPSWSWASIEGRVDFYHLIDAMEGVEPASICEIVNIHLLKSGKSTTGALKGGYLNLRGRLHRVAIHDNLVQFKGEDGTFGYIKGSSEDLGENDEDTNRTRALLDECTMDDQPVISQMKTAGINMQQGADFENVSRDTKLAEEWDNGELFILPLIEWAHPDSPRVAGLVIYRAEGEPDGRYQRVGSFNCIGEIPTSYIKAGDLGDLVLV